VFRVVPPVTLRRTTSLHPFKRKSKDNTHRLRDNQDQETAIAGTSGRSHSEFLTAFLQLQEFSLRNLPVVSSTSAARLSFNNSKEGLVWFSLRRQLYVLRLI
jgi:hypothetical protein